MLQYKCYYDYCNIAIMRLQYCEYAVAWYVTQEDENNDKVVGVPSLEGFFKLSTKPNNRIL